MSKQTALTFNDSAFRRDLSYLKDKYLPDKIKKGLTKAGYQLKSDADEVEPKTPKDEGILRSYGAVLPVVKTRMGFSIIVGYFAPYASKLHEGEETWNWSEPGSGPRFLIEKLIRFKNDYVGTVADEIKGGL